MRHAQNLNSEMLSADAHLLSAALARFGGNLPHRRIMTPHITTKRTRTFPMRAFLVTIPFALLPPQTTPEHAAQTRPQSLSRQSGTHPAYKSCACGNGRRSVWPFLPEA